MFKFTVLKTETRIIRANAKQISGSVEGISHSVENRCELREVIDRRLAVTCEVSSISKGSRRILQTITKALKHLLFRFLKWFRLNSQLEFMKNQKRETPKRSIELQASHTPFTQMIDFCVRGRANPVLQSSAADDHVAELCMLVHEDIDGDLWSRDTAAAAGMKARKILDGLADRVLRQADERAASILYSIATQASYEVLDLYLRRRELFDRIAPRRKLLPCLFSVHPRTREITKRMDRDARLGEKTDDARRVGSKAWFLNDAPANIYARAIIESIGFNRRLDSIEKQQRSWVAYDRKYGVQTLFLPFPQYIANIDAVPVAITPACVLDYWRKGKEIILEEMPKFHERPEWEEYRTRRRYSHGAKTGAIQHAIFNDILAALRTIAGANKYRASAAP